MKASEILQQALDLLGPRGEYWGKRHYEEFGRYCAQGAIWQTDAADAAAECELLAVINTSSLELWNDQPSRTFAEVKAAFELAIKNCRDREAA